MLFFDGHICDTKPELDRSKLFKIPASRALSEPLPLVCRLPRPTRHRQYQTLPTTCDRQQLGVVESTNMNGLVSWVFQGIHQVQTSGIKFEHLLEMFTNILPYFSSSWVPIGPEVGGHSHGRPETYWDPLQRWHQCGSAWWLMVYIMANDGWWCFRMFIWSFF